VASKRAWFAARPSGTEDLYKIYAESFVSPAHLQEVLQQAQALVDGVLAGTQ
jgi:phosphoglucomutase